MITLKNLSIAEMSRAAAEARGEFEVLALTPDNVLSVDEHRLRRVMLDTGADLAYGNYIKNGTPVPLIENQWGAVRDDFDFGPVVMVRTRRLREFVSACAAGLRYSAFYAFWLECKGRMAFVPEFVAAVASAESEAEGEAQFNYVDPRNRQVQIEREEVFTEWLARRHALVGEARPIEHTGDFPLEASVIIPVKNRVRTVGDAIRSALSQLADFEFNVLVVDNHSDDGTTELVASLAETDRRVIHIIPEPGHGIGGCWNVAVDSPYCGRFAVQLDSDDVYSSPDTLQKVVDKFRESGAAMVIGSYTLTDFDLNVIPPGLIDHKEWTDANGPNNALRINGLGAPRAFFTPVARELRFPDVSYGEDYAMALRVSRHYRIGRIFDSLYFCRRWGGNSDSNLSQERINANNRYKDWVRSVELIAREEHD